MDSSSVPASNAAHSSPSSSPTGLVKGPQRPPLLRRKLIVDKEAQYTYLVYVILLGCLFTVFNIAASMLWHFMIGSVDSLHDLPSSTIFCTLIAISLLGLLTILAAVVAANVVSNTLAGPVWRLNGSLKKILAGGNIEPVSFRDKDQFHEVAQNYNLLLLELADLRAKVKSMSPTSNLQNSDEKEGGN